MTSFPAAPVSDAVLLAALRPLLRAVVRQPGVLYAPLYVGPLAQGGVLERELRAMADLDGVAVWTSPAALTHEPGVLLLPLDRMTSLAGQITQDLASNQQLVVWGAVSPDQVPPPLADWLRREGLAVDPRPLAALGGDAAFGRTLARCAQARGASYNPILVATPTGRRSVVAAEIALRLELGGMARIASVPGPLAAAEAALADIGDALLVMPAPGWSPGVLAEATPVRDAIQRGVQVVVLVEHPVHADLGETAVWRAAFPKRILLDIEPVAGRALAALAPNPVDGPALADLLPGIPVRGTPPMRMLNGHASADTIRLEQTIQGIASGGQTGRLVLWSRDRIGCLDVDQGRLISAWLAGDRWTPEALVRTRGLAAGSREAAAAIHALLEDWAVRVATWDDVHFVLCRGPALVPAPNLRTVLDASTIVFEALRRVGEALRRAELGSFDAVWQRAGSIEVADPLSPICIIWERLDGMTPLRAIADAAGLLDEECWQAVEALVRSRAATRVHRGEVDVANRVDPATVVTTLWSWGLTAEAVALARELAAVGVLLPPPLAAVILDEASEMLLARWPALPAGGADSQPVFDDTLARAVVAHRAGTMPVGDVWPAVGAVVRAHGANARWTPRHYAALATLARWAGDCGTADRALAELRASADPTAAALARALAPSM